MELLRKLRAFLADPRTKLWWAQRQVGEVILLARQRRVGALLGYVVAAVTGWRVYDLYIRYLSRRHDGTVERDVRGHRMVLDLEDKGISRDLFLYGTREECGTDRFAHELRQLDVDPDEAVVVDVGANIGYFALTEHRATPPGTEVVAFEPDERNATLLERNLELNGYREETTIERAAVGASRGTARLELSDHSNLNRVRTDAVSDWRYANGESVSVDMWSVDAYLRARDIDPASVVAVRMDIEGYEAEAVQGMRRVLEADGPLVLSVELHAGLLDRATVRSLLDEFAALGFEVVDALSEEITNRPFADTREAESPRSLSDTGPAYNLILRKEATTAVSNPGTNGTKPASTT